MGALIGLVAGVGLWLIWSAFTLPRPAQQSSRTGQWLRALLDRAGLTGVSTRSLVGLTVGLGTVVTVLMQAISRTPPVAATFGLLAAWLPIAVVRSRARQRQREFALVWPEAVDNLASAVRAGLALPEALAGLAIRGPEPLRPAFASFGRDYHSSGRFGPSLDRLKVALSDPVGDRVIEALRLAREVGGGELGKLLRNLSTHLRDDERTRSELESRQAWTINGARLAVAAPWAVLLLMSLSSASVTAFATPLGTAVLAGGAACCLLAYRLMLRIGRLPVEQRVLA